MGGVVKMKKLTLSISVILLYFLWPYFSNFIINSANLGNSILINILSNFVCLTLILLIYFNDLKKDLKKYIKNYKNYTKKTFKYFLYGLLGYVLINFIIAISLQSFNISNDNINALESEFANNIIPLIITTMFYYPIIEELVFKKTFKDIIKNKWLFVIISAFANAFFAYAFSATNVITLVYIIPSTIFYMGLSYSYYESNNIFVPIIYRIIYNAIPNIALLIETLLIIKIP